MSASAGAGASGGSENSSGLSDVRPQKSRVMSATERKQITHVYIYIYYVYFIKKLYIYYINILYIIYIYTWIYYVIYSIHI